MGSKATGLVYIFTGDGKGKTSAALGVAMRAVGQGKKVAMVQWYKERRWEIGEHNLPLILERTKEAAGSFEIYPMGQGFYKLPTDHATANDHKTAAQQALKFAGSLLVHHPSSIIHYPLFLLVLDEALNAVADKLIQLNQLVKLISLRGSVHIILTGRNAPKELIDLADLVTEMKNIKHPFDSGKKAVMGLDY
jgi:cob(I)alamin adenosyltransferase